MHRTDVWTVIMRDRCYHSMLLICLTSCWKENTTHTPALTEEARQRWRSCRKMRGRYMEREERNEGKCTAATEDTTAELQTGSSYN